MDTRVGKTERHIENDRDSTKTAIVKKGKDKIQ